MLTRWGRVLDADHPLPEYPRPQLVRERWVNLNGRWEHAFTRDDQRPARYAGPIVVPFSPEAELSGVGRQLQPDERLWYRRRFTPPHGERVLLHFGAVDQTCTVWVNGVEQGSHTGGYLPFSFDVTAALVDGENVARGPRARPLRDRSARPRQAAARPRRDLVHRAVGHLADGLARAGPRGARRATDPRPPPRECRARGDGGGQRRHRERRARRHHHHDQRRCPDAAPGPGPPRLDTRRPLPVRPHRHDGPGPRLVVRRDALVRGARGEVAAQRRAVRPRRACSTRATGPMACSPPRATRRWSTTSRRWRTSASPCCAST